MKFKKLFIVLVLFFVCSLVGNVFAEDLEIEEGKTLKFDFRGYNNWYDDTKVYDNINIGAGTKVVLGGEWEHVLLSSSVAEVEYKNRDIVIPGSTETAKVQDEIQKTVYEYKSDENIVTLSIKQDGKIVLNSGSELSIRNQYSLITSTQDVSLTYEENEDEIVLLDKGYESNYDNMYEYEQYNEKGKLVHTFDNRIRQSNVELFCGDIVFESGDVDTTLTFQKINTAVSLDFVLPTSGSDVVIGTTSTNGKVIRSDEIIDLSIDTPSDDYDKTIMTNNFVINSNRAVFNVESGLSGYEEYDSSKGSVILTSNPGETSYITGNGCIIKDGDGILNLEYDTENNRKIDATGLTGSNTDGCGWIIEKGKLLVHDQTNLGNSDIKISSEGILQLGTILSSLSNDIIFLGDGNHGYIGLSGGTDVVLSGNISTNGGVAKIEFYEDSHLNLTGKNDAETFYLSFSGAKNELITDIDGLATKRIIGFNGAETDKEFAFLELVMDEDNNREYSGSLEGELYLRKTGSGIVTLSGNNSYTEGTYITEGGLLLANSTALGTGNIWFDGGTKGSSITYSNIGVSSTTVGDITMTNNIHVKNGAIFDVYENQNMTILGDLVSYDARPGYETEFIKNGLGEVKISGTLDANRQVTISSFTVTEGGFVLDKNIVLDSYFSLNGEKAYLEMYENAGVKNNIDVFNGDLTIFNEHNISSSTAINFYSEATSTDSFSKLHTTSTTVLTADTVATQINIKKNIEFVTEATTTVNFNKFNFEAGSDIVIVKSGEGSFVADNNGADFDVNSLYLNEGILRLENANITVSSKTFVDGGVLSISSTSHFASTATSPEDKKIIVLNGGIGIYDDNSIDGATKLSFEGTDSENLSKLIVEAANVNLTNDIYVKTGLIIENENDLTFSGDSITYDPSSPGIIAKSGKGTMTIDSAGTFEMGEVRSLEGNLLVKSDISVSTVAISGKKAILSFDNVDSANISKELSISNNGLLSLTNSTINVANIDVISSTITLNDINSKINATNINVVDKSLIYGIGNYNSTINMKDDSIMCIGEDKSSALSSAYSKEKASALMLASGTLEIESLNVKNIVFESGSTLKIDVKSEGGVTSSDKLIVDGDITVQKDVELEVNLMGASSEYATTKSFEFITYSGNGTFANSSNEIFNIILSNPRFSVSTMLDGNSIFLQIVQEYPIYEIPGMTENQKSVVDLLNTISSDSTVVDKLSETIGTLDVLYGTYVDTGNKAPFINAIQDLSGIFYANSFMTSAMLSKANLIYNRLNDYSKEREFDNRVWAQVYTNNFTIAENEENPKFENNIYGMIAGYDTINDENLVFGIAGFYGQGQLKQLDDKADISDAGVNVYGDYKIQENIDVKGLLGYSSQNYDTTRELRFNKQEIKSKYATNTINVDLEVAYRYDFNDKVSLKPLIGANCAVVSNGDIEEDGSAEQRLKIEKNSYTKADVRIGVGIQSKAVSPFNWYVSAVAKQIVTGDKFTTKASFANVSKYDFEIESTKLASTSFGGNIGCSYDITPNFNVSLDLNADTGSASMFGGNIGASYRW